MCTVRPKLSSNKALRTCGGVAEEMSIKIFLGASTREVVVVETEAVEGVETDKDMTKRRRCKVWFFRNYEASS